MSFNYNIIKEQKALIIQLSGKLLDGSQFQEILDELECSEEEKLPQVIVDLQQLEYLNSSGLNSLIALLTKVRNCGSDVVLTNLNEKIKQLFIITKLNSVFTITESKTEALNTK
ncbi:MAG: hypothetical protein Kow0079_04750 [Vicingaceae bacterium]